MVVFHSFRGWQGSFHGELKVASTEVSEVLTGRDKVVTSGAGAVLRLGGLRDSTAARISRCSRRRGSAWN